MLWRQGHFFQLVPLHSVWCYIESLWNAGIINIAIRGILIHSLTHSTELILHQKFHQYPAPNPEWCEGVASVFLSVHAKWWQVIIYFSRQNVQFYWEFCLTGGNLISSNSFQRNIHNMMTAVCPTLSPHPAHPDHLLKIFDKDFVIKIVNMLSKSNFVFTIIMIISTDIY